MPVVQLNLDRLQKIVGKKLNKNKIISKIPFLGLDIEEQTKDFLRVEYSPNRPDYATDFGIGLGLQGLLGLKKGIPKLFVKKGNYNLKVDSSVKKIRPYVTSIVAKNGTLDDESIRQLITLQEDLHFGIGRRRKKSSIGIHDLDRISFPIKYTTVTKNHKFVPLDSSKETSSQYVCVCLIVCLPQCCVSVFSVCVSLSVCLSQRVCQCQIACLCVSLRMCLSQCVCPV